VVLDLNVYFLKTIFIFKFLKFKKHALRKKILLRYNLFSLLQRKEGKRLFVIFHFGPMFENNFRENIFKIFIKCTLNRIN